MNFEELADQVLAIDGSKSRSDVILDLKFTKSLEETINRIFDGEFLKGVLQQQTDNNTSNSNEALVILDSDEEETDLFDTAIKKPSQTHFSFDFSDDIEGDLDNTKRRHSLDFLDDDLPIIEDKAREESPSFDIARSPLPAHRKERSFDFDFDPPSVTDDRSVELDSIELSPIHKLADKSNEDDFLFSLSNSPPQRDPFAFDYEKESDSKKETSASESISLIDSDSEGSLPSMDDLFDKLISQKKRPRKPIEEEIAVDRKGKRRAYEFNLSPSHSPAISQTGSESTTYLDTNDEGLTAKERKKLLAEEKKRAQAEERKRVAEEKKRLREEKIEEKKRLKEQKQLEKERSQLIEKENRLKNDRTEILKEIIVDMHPDFYTTVAGTLLKSILERKEAITKSVEHEKHHVSWRRVVKSEWNEETLTFIPYDLPKIIKEPYVLVYLNASDFVKRIKEDTINEYIDDIQSSAPNDQVMLLVEGLETYYSKKKNLQRRQFENQIRSTIEGAAAAASTSRRKKEQEIEDGPDREQVEECINYLQLIKSVMFVITKSDEDSASWLDSLTTDLALRRYKLKNANNAHKVVKSGLDPSDAYSRMLQEIQLCTPSVAQSVLNEYPTLQSLHRAYERRGTAEGEMMLANLEVERSALQSRDRKINRVMSKKIHNIFNCTDPDKIIY